MDLMRATFILISMKRGLKESLEFSNTIGLMVVSVSDDNEDLSYLDDVPTYEGDKTFIER